MTKSNRKPHTILLRPTSEAIAAGIFDGDAFGGRPGTMLWDGQIWTGPGCTVAGVGAQRMAIVLAGEGEWLPLGVAALAGDDGYDYNEVAGLLRRATTYGPPVCDVAIDVLRWLLEEDGALVLLDEHGGEM